MKIHKYITASLISAAFVMTGCSDSFLEVTSPTQEFIDTYYTTDEHIQEALVAAYNPLYWQDYSQDNGYTPINLMSDVMADDLWVGGNNTTDNKEWHLMMNFEALPKVTIEGLWACAYTGVKRCNDVITYLGWAGDNVSATNRALYEAEATALRAYYYSWVWKFWGNIPYYEVNLTSPYLAEQFKADEVYQKIVGDLETVIALNLFPMREKPENYGRVTQAMLYMLYAEVVMYQNDETRYAKALLYMKDIINSTKYDLVDDYADIFKESGEWSEESIFEINYIDDNAVRGWTNSKYAGGTVLPTLLSPYKWTDGADDHNHGWGFCPVRQETYDRYSANDTRRDATCWNAQAYVDAYNEANPITPANPTKFDYEHRYQDTGLFLEKYAAHASDNADQKADSEVNYNDNLRIYRFSETLLNAAELLVRTSGPAADAKTYLNKVRKRAGLVTELEPTIDNIIKERQLEFVGEGKRYWDLIRTGKAATTLVPDEYGYRTNTWTPSKKYLPIPQGEIDSSLGTLIQNNY